MPEQCSQARPHEADRPEVTSAAIDAAALNAWRAGVIVELARTEVCDHAPLAGPLSAERVCAHVERVDAILAGAAALLRELHGDLRAADDRLAGRR